MEVFPSGFLLSLASKNVQEYIDMLLVLVLRVPRQQQDKWWTYLLFLSRK